MEVSRFVLFTLLTLLILSQSQRRRRVRQKKKGLVRNRELEDENASRKRIKRISCLPKEMTLAVNRELEDLKEMRNQMDHMREEIDDMKQNLISLGTTSLGPGDFHLRA